jgi:hypothetical protein
MLHAIKIRFFPVARFATTPKSFFAKRRGKRTRRIIPTIFVRASSGKETTTIEPITVAGTARVVRMSTSLLRTPRFFNCENLMILPIQVPMEPKLNEPRAICGGNTKKEKNWHSNQSGSCGNTTHKSTNHPNKEYQNIN